MRADYQMNFYLLLTSLTVSSTTTTPVSTSTATFIRSKRYHCEEEILDAQRTDEEANDKQEELIDADQLYDGNEDTCKARCDAQWKSDFNMHFQKSYDEDFYEFPLDGSVTSSLKNFTTFCRITKEKVKCWEEQCHLQRQSIPWTTDVHICLFRRKQFEDSLDCLNKTSHGAHNGCNKLCRKASKKYHLSSAEKKYLSNLHLSASNIHQYHQLNKQCYFQICQLKCRGELTRRICDPNDRKRSIDVLEDYYKSDQLDQLHFLETNGSGAVFPIVCRRLLSARNRVNHTASEDVEVAMQNLGRMILNNTDSIIANAT